MRFDRFAWIEPNGTENWQLFRDWYALVEAQGVRLDPDGTLSATEAARVIAAWAENSKDHLGRDILYRLGPSLPYKPPLRRIKVKR